jgi:threonine aldolase
MMVLLLREDVWKKKVDFATRLATEIRDGCAVAKARSTPGSSVWHTNENQVFGIVERLKCHSNGL